MCPGLIWLISWRATSPVAPAADVEALALEPLVDGPLARLRPTQRERDGGEVQSTSTTSPSAAMARQPVHAQAQNSASSSGCRARKASSQIT